MKSLLAALVLVAGTGTCFALTGNDALEWHRQANGKTNLALAAYVRGALDGERAFEELLRARSEQSPAYREVWLDMAPKMFCPPSGVQAGQAYDILVNWLQQQPEQRQVDLAVHLRVALRQAWKCPP